MGTDPKSRVNNDTDFKSRIMAQVISILIGLAVGGASSQLLGLSGLAQKVENLNHAIEVMQQDHERINSLSTEVAVLKTEMNAVKRHVGLAKLDTAASREKDIAAKTGFVGEPRQLDNIDVSEKEKH